MNDSKPKWDKKRLARGFERIFKIIHSFSPWRFYRRRQLLIAKRRGNKLIARNPMTGCLMELDPNQKVTQAWYVRADYEPNMTAGLQRFLRPGMVCMDIGANAGLFSLLMAKQVESTGMVYSFEPTPVTFKQLQKNIALNSQLNITAENVAVTEQSGKVELHVGPPELCVYNSISEVVHPSARTGQFTVISVPAITIDDYCLKNNIKRVDCVKIDVEGAEFQVLKGMKHVLKENLQIVLIIEFYSVTAAANGTSVPEMVGWLKNMGFQLFVVNAKGRLQTIESDFPENGEMVWAKRPLVL